MTAQYQGVWSLQSAAQLQSTQRWVTDPLFENTTLLLQADDAANGAQNNTFLDSSSNAFAITRNGNTTQGSFTPFSLQPGAWSTYFPGASSLVVPAGSAFAYGTGNFTVEAWINPYTYQAGSSAGGQIISQTTSGQNYFVVQLGAAGELNFTFGSGGGTTILTAPGSIPLGIWTHVAVVREGTGANQLKLYVNGFLLQSGTCSFDFTDTTYNPTVGNYTHNSTQLPFGGYISNLRVVKGVAVYTGNFTPSALPLTATQSAGINTAAITGTQTSLLTAQSNRFLDNSVANAGGGWTVTLGGTPSVQPFSPFAPQFQWTPSVIGGSGFFDGTGDNVSAAANDAFQFGTGNFCVEAWVYITNTATVASGRRIFSKYSFIAGSNYGMILQVFRTSASSVEFELWNAAGVSQLVLTANPALAGNAWHHLAVARSGANASLYVNGSRLATTSSAGSANDNWSTAVTIGSQAGADASTVFQGYISSARMVKGSSVYDPTLTTLTVPTAPLTAVTNTSLLLNFTNAGIYDGTMKNNLETVGNAQISTAVVKYGSGSMFFDGTGDYLTSNSGTDLYAFGSGDFTIEMWVNFNVVNTIQCVYDNRPSGGQGAYSLIYLNSDGTIRYWVSSADRITSSAVVANTWYHVAVCRLGTATRMFINGTQTGSTYTDSTVYLNATGRPWIGINSSSTNTQAFNGYIDDLRVTRGIARYTQNFIPPSVALPRQ